MTTVASPTGPIDVKIPTLVAPQGDSNAIELQRTAVSLIGQAETLAVTDDASLKLATELGAAIQKNRKALEDLREQFKRPALEFGRAVDSFYRPAIQRCDDVKRALGERIFGYQDKLRREAEERRRAEEEKARKEKEEADRIAAEAAKAAAESGDLNADIEAEQKRLAAQEAGDRADVAAAAPVPIVETGARAASGGGVSARMEWTFEVTDRNAVPREFLVVDERAIAAYVKARKGQVEIAGVRVFQKPVSSWRG